ncbi:MAG: manganese efflux pump MntP family protein [Butyrivibrio sp.]
MDIFTLILLAVGLAMDAFAVSICKGLSTTKLSVKHMFIVGGWFGGFQALMPLIGYFLGIQFAHLIQTVSSWIAFALLVIIGANMIREAFSKDEEQNEENAFGFKTMFIMAIATSIDALAIGITFACIPVQVLSASAFINTLFGVGVIGIVTFIISAAGVKIGNVFGSIFKNKAQIAGGVILILLGIKILLEYFGIIKF